MDKGEAREQSDRHLERLSCILLGAALVSDEVRKSIEPVLSEAAKRSLPDIPRKLLTSILQRDGKDVWDHLSRIGVTRQEDNERAISAVQREFERTLGRRVVRRLQSELAGRTYDSAPEFQEAISRIVEQLKGFE